jgi:hypothetical protein
MVALRLVAVPDKDLQCYVYTPSALKYTTSLIFYSNLNL